MIEYILHRKCDDRGWYPSKTSFSITDFTEQDQWYFNHLLEEGNWSLRVGASIYEINQRNPSTFTTVTQ